LPGQLVLPGTDVLAFDAQQCSEDTCVIVQARSPIIRNAARDYDSASDQYMETDPAQSLMAVTTPEPYLYAGQRPLSMTDPTGSWRLDPSTCRGKDPSKLNALILKAIDGVAHCGADCPRFPRLALDAVNGPMYSSFFRTLWMFSIVNTTYYCRVPLAMFEPLVGGPWCGVQGFDFHQVFLSDLFWAGSEADAGPEFTCGGCGESYIAHEALHAPPFSFKHEMGPHLEPVDPAKDPDYRLVKDCFGCAPSLRQ
jgi:hypothetical protein